MFELKASKQTRSEGSKNKVSNNEKSIKHINKQSKSKYIINQISFGILQKSRVILNWKKNIT